MQLQYFLAVGQATPVVDFPYAFLLDKTFSILPTAREQGKVNKKYIKATVIQRKKENITNKYPVQRISTLTAVFLRGMIPSSCCPQLCHGVHFAPNMMNS